MTKQELHSKVDEILAEQQSAREDVKVVLQKIWDVGLTDARKKILLAFPPFVKILDKYEIEHD